MLIIFGGLLWLYSYGNPFSCLQENTMSEPKSEQKVAGQSKLGKKFMYVYSSIWSDSNVMGYD